MPAKRSLRPTDAELDILRILWQRGPCTVREVHEALGGDRSRRYTTTLKQLQIMGEKKLVRRNESQRSHVYSAALDETFAKTSIVGGLIERVFGGSASKLVLHAIEVGDLSDDELADIRRLVRKREVRR